MAKRTTSVDKTPIDPRFVIPIGAEEVFSYTDEFVEIEDDGADVTGGEFSSIEYDDGTESDYFDYTDDGYDDQEQIILETPEIFVVFSQSLKRAPGGQQVVDVVLQIEDIDGAEDYEIQVVKT